MPLLRLLARIWTVLLGLTTLALFFGLMARFLLPLAPWTEAPGLPVIMPSDSSAEVLPRSEISLRFNTPMNRRTTGAALRIEPPTPGSYRWSDDAQTLTFTPAGTLAPAATYTVTLETTALDRWWRPLPVPVQSIFRTAPLPAVVSALPNDLAALPQNTLAVVFSQAMVAAEQVGRDIEVPQLQFTPSVDVDMQWIDQRTLILLPDTPLQSATRYTVTIAPDLSDLRGVDLGTPFSWSFATAWPSVSERNPPSGERWAGPRQALSFYLSAPLDRELLRRSLQISPAVIGRVDVTPAGAGQLVTFTPTNGWTPGSSYSVTFQTPDDLAIGAPPDLRWRFTVEPEPGLVAFFPGQSQLLPPDQAVRLVFSTPMEEEALRAGLRIEPPVADPAITVSGTEVRLRPDLEPSTNYTITIAAGTLDRTGEPLADPVIVRLRTAAADPFLAAPDALANLITLPISQSAVVDLERVNLSRLDLSLYKLDSPTLLRAFGFSADEWREFNPERYGQSLARRWQADLDDPDDSAISSGLPIGLNDGGLLDPGAYYLRVLSREGPRLDLIVLVSDLRITLRHSDNQALVWATDTRSGAPVAGVPVAIYAGDALITRGITGDDGIWEQPIRRNPQDPPYLVVAEGPQPAIADARWSRSQPAEPRHRALL
ncbi:MAG: hypothetical protein HC822_27855 [Oscillochloris sp.]|nr:hypothetical protein [Oscillochloris sp.]